MCSSLLYINTAPTPIIFFRPHPIHDKPTNQKKCFLPRTFVPSPSLPPWPSCSWPSLPSKLFPRVQVPLSLLNFWEYACWDGHLSEHWLWRMFFILSFSCAKLRRMPQTSNLPSSLLPSRLLLLREHMHLPYWVQEGNDPFLVDFKGMTRVHAAALYHAWFKGSSDKPLESMLLVITISFFLWLKQH